MSNLGTVAVNVLALAILLCYRHLLCVMCAGYNGGKLDLKHCCTLERFKRDGAPGNR